VKAYRRLRVAEVIAETADACSLVLDVPPAMAADFAYRPGQYLTVRVPRGGDGTVSRCYSLSSSPHTDEKPKITIKRVREGHASNWICDNVRAGTELEVLTPAGSFTPGSLDGDLLLLAGGSGITPMLSIIKSALAHGSGHLALVYANRDAGSVIFHADLLALAERHPDRLCVTHWLDASQGPPTADRLGALLSPYSGRDAYACGPEPFVAVACAALAAIGLPEERIHIERWESTVDASGAGDPVATAEVDLDGQVRRLPWPANMRLLDLLIAEGMNPPFSCRQGTCGACACRVVSGEVELVHNEVLEDEDFAEGYTLACQALPRSETVIVTYS
jgi:3-ketosteroid 9alpha-monooxygenase subunit B